MRRRTRRRRIAFALLFELGLGVVAVILGLVLNHPPLDSFHAGAAGAVGGAVATLPLLALLFFVWSSRAEPLRKLKNSVRRMVNGYFGRLSLVEAVALSLAAGAGEELLFRGFLQSWLAALFGAMWPALLIASAAFGAVHWHSGVYFAYAAVLGMVLGAVFWLTGDLLAAVICHAAYDTVALLTAQRRSGVSSHQLSGKRGSFPRSLRGTNRDLPGE